MAFAKARRFALPVMLLASLAVVIPVHSQGGPGGGGSGAGIPLSSGGNHNDEEKPDPKTLKERPVKGIVTDTDGNPVSGAVVQLKNTRTNQVRSLITHEKGDYSFTGLSKDIDYELKAVYKDQSSDPHTLSKLDSRPQPTVNLKLK